MRAVQAWADEARGEDLGASRHRLNRGYRCSVVLDGDSTWTITCKQGGRHPA